MDWTRQCAVVIPCLNEAGRIGPLVSAIRKTLPSVIVIDDGSSDGTAGAAKSAGAAVLHNDCTGGKGRALRQGLAQAVQTGFDWALAMDGDGQHAPEDIAQFLAAAARTEALLVVGNRMPQACSMPWIRRAVNRWMSRKLSALTGLKLPDSQCGFRLINLHALGPLSLQCDHYEIESELLVEFSRAGHRVEFVPIQVIYKGERSRIRCLADTVRWFRWWRRAKRSWTGRGRR